MIEMMLVNVEGFSAGSEFVSKFGLRITDEITFVVSVDDGNSLLILL